MSKKNNQKKCKVAFYGGSFNPPTLAHQKIISHLLDNDFFSKVIVKPCGYRSDKFELNREVEIRRNKIISNLAYVNDKFLLDLSGIEKPMRATWSEWNELKQKYASDEIWIVCGMDLFEKAHRGRSQVHGWIEGENLFMLAPFYVFNRKIVGLPDLPPNVIVAENFEMMDISSTELRGRSCH